MLTKEMTEKMKAVLIWLPVILLPLVNIIVMIVDSADYDVAILWVVGAVVEELFFRWFLLKTIFLPRMKSILAIFLVSVLFACMHLFNLRTGQGLPATLLQMGCGFSFGIWAGVVTWKTTWLIPLLAHILLNVTAVAENPWVSAAVGIVVFFDGLLLMKGVRWLQGL